MDEFLSDENSIISFMRPRRVCLCRQVSEEEIIEAIQSGCNTMEKLIEKTQATTGCGTCSVTVKSIMERENKKLNFK